ncbi:amidohydrolase family protein [Croceibacterium sp. TMG7-5b_MA50]|uniref:amidohydrolase family protein n=1 Tax=Croceibacterium sp. TMG7-5b_MA50 TaxID=3121290 RepID=UPI00322188AC
MTGRWALALAGTAALMTGTALAQVPPPSPVELPAGEHVTFDVNEGTSMALSLSPDGRRMVIDLQGSLWILPVGGGRARRITDYFNDARLPVWSPDGTTIAFSGYRDGTWDLYTIKPDGSDLRHVTQGAADDREPAWSPDSRSLAFSSDRNGSTYTIWTVDLASGTLRQVSPGLGEDRMPSWSADGTEIAYSSQRATSSLKAVASTGEGEERVLREGAVRYDAPVWGPDGQLAYVAYDPAGSRLEVDGVPVSGSENVFPFRPVWRGEALFYTSDGLIRRRQGSRMRTVPFTARLEVVRPQYQRAARDWDSTAPQQALGILKPTLSPDGQSIAFVALGDLYTVPVTGGRPTNLTTDHAMDADPAWSPDGKWIAWSSDHGGGLPQLWLRNVASGETRRLTNLTTQPLGAAWSPDGKRIAFIDVDGRWGVAGLQVVDVATGAVTRLSASLPQPGEPSWSADGQHVAISLSRTLSRSFREGTNQVVVFRADGTGEPVWHEPQPGTGIDTRGGGGPAWSPDGTRMAAIYEGLLKVWWVGPDGTPQSVPRALNDEISHYPTWSGDGRTILYQNAEKLKLIDVETGAIRDVPLDLSYTLARPAGRTIIRTGALVDSVTDATQANKDIVIEGNRIVAIRDRDPSQDAGATVIDASTLTAIPGLIEHHSHAQKDFGAAGHRAWLAYGITTVRDPGNQVYSGIEDREAQMAGVRIGPRIYANGPLLEWQRVFYKMGVAVANPPHLERELDRARRLRFDVLKSYVRMPDLQQRRIVEAAHAMGVPVTGHEIFPAALNGVDATEHTGATSRRGYSPKQGPQGRSYQDVIQLFGRSGRTMTPTMFGSLGPYLQKHPEYRSDPRAKLYPQWAQATVTGDDPMAALIGPLMAGSMQLVKDAHDAGALIAAGTDTLIATNLHSEIATYVDAGLTPFQALQTVTVNAAKSLNLDAGTLEPGKLADIVLLDGDPRSDIANTFKVRQVMVNGVLYTGEQLLTEDSDD